MVVASTNSTTPDLGEITQTPESRAALASMPVPTAGASVVRSGTACLCMLDPIRARFASSFCRNGTREVATENTILGETSMYSKTVFL